MGAARAPRFKMFILAFAASFLVLAAGAAYAVVKLSEIPPPEIPGESAPANSGYVPREEDLLTLVLIGSDTSESLPAYFTLVRFNVLRGQIPVFSFPWCVGLVYNGEMMTARDIVLLGGEKALMEALKSELGITAEKYVRWDGEGCVAVVNKLGAVDFSLSKSLYYNDGWRLISLMKGMQRMDGKKFFDAVSFPAYGGELERCDMISKLTAALFNKRIVNLTASGGNYFDEVINSVKSDITAVDYANMAPALNFFAGLDVTISSHVTAEATWNEAGTMLILTDETRARLEKYFID